MLVLSVGQGTHGFTLDREFNNFILTHPDLRIPNETRDLALDIPTQDELEWTIGPPLIDSFRLLAGHDHGDAGVAFYRERYADIGLFENRVYDGVPDALTALPPLLQRLRD